MTCRRDGNDQFQKASVFETRVSLLPENTEIDRGFVMMRVERNAKMRWKFPLLKSYPQLIPLGQYVRLGIEADMSA